MLKIAAGCVLFALLYATNVQCYHQQMQEIMAEIDENCRKGSGVSAENMAEFKKENYPEDPALKCYIKCLMVKKLAMDDSGQVLFEGALGYALLVTPPGFEKEVTAFIRKCSLEVGSDPCDKAFRIQKCYNREAPQALLDLYKQ